MEQASRSLPENLELRTKLRRLRCFLPAAIKWCPSQWPDHKWRCDWKNSRTDVVGNASFYNRSPACKGCDIRLTKRSFDDVQEQALVFWSFGQLLSSLSIGTSVDQTGKTRENCKVARTRGQNFDHCLRRTMRPTCELWKTYYCKSSSC